MHVRCWCWHPSLHCRLQVWLTASAGLTCSQCLLVPGRPRRCLTELWDAERFWWSQGTFSEGGERSELEAFDTAIQSGRGVHACALNEEKL